MVVMVMCDGFPPVAPMQYHCSQFPAPCRWLPTVGRLELARVDHPKAAARFGREGGDEVTGLGHRLTVPRNHENAPSRLGPGANVG